MRFDTTKEVVILCTKNILHFYGYISVLITCDASNETHNRINKIKVKYFLYNDCCNIKFKVCKYIKH